MIKKYIDFNFKNDKCSFGTFNCTSYASNYVLFGLYSNNYVILYAICHHCSNEVKHSKHTSLLSAHQAKSILALQ
jgi:hypothetical protein